MKALFDETEYTKWYISDEGKLYSITTYNRSDNRNRTLHEVKPNINKARGYLYARTANRNYQIHRLVASAFIPNPNNKKYVNHKDGNKHNNHKNNLEWCTAVENAQHALKVGLTTQLKKNEGNIKYSLYQCRGVVELIRGGMSYKKAGAKYNMPYSTVAHLMRGSRRSL